MIRSAAHATKYMLAAELLKRELADYEMVQIETYALKADVNLSKGGSQ